MAEILVSTGALIGKANGRDYRLLKDFEKKLNCDGFEFMMYGSWYEEIDEIVEFLTENNIFTPVYHCQKSIGESISKGGKEDFEDAFTRFELNAKMASQIGAKKMVMHLWDGRTSDQHFENNLEGYKTVRSIAEQYGVDLLVENVVCNQQDPFTHWKELLETYPDIHFIFDTKMAAFHNQLEELYSRENERFWKEKHICHYHVNDYGGGYMDWKNLRTLPIREGRIDFESFFKFVKKTGYDGTFTLESTAFHDDGEVDFEMLNAEVEYVRSRWQYV